MLKLASMMESNRGCAELPVGSCLPRHELHKRRHPSEIPRKFYPEMRDLHSGRAPWPLFQWGPSGVGKSCLALCMLDHTTPQTHYWTVEKLCEHLIACGAGSVDTGGLHPVGVSRREYWKELAGSRLVVLDELGERASVSDHHIKTVKRLLDSREGKPLIVISNLRASGLEEVYDDRTASRVASGTIMDWSGFPDRRLQRTAIKAATAERAKEKT